MKKWWKILALVPAIGIIGTAAITLSHCGSNKTPGGGGDNREEIDDFTITWFSDVDPLPISSWDLTTNYAADGINDTLSYQIQNPQPNQVNDISYDYTVDWYKIYDNLGKEVHDYLEWKRINPIFYLKKTDLTAGNYNVKVSFTCSTTKDTKYKPHTMVWPLPLNITRA